MANWQDKPCTLGTYRTSRDLWKQRYGDPGKFWVLHYCDQKTCRELTHLFLGTARQNNLASRNKVSDSTRPLVATVTHDGETSEICRPCLESLTPEDYAEAKVQLL
jgi:hypothetical protein